MAIIILKVKDIINITINIKNLHYIIKMGSLRHFESRVFQVED